MKTKPTSISLISCSALALFFASCGGDKSEPESSSSAESSPVLESILVATEPSGSVSVAKARESAKPGDTITVTGKIAGATSPFTEGFATVILADHALQTCDLTEDDLCPMPWDACCEDPDIVASLRMSFQVLGEDGRPVPQSLKGVNGMKEMDGLVVTGTVAEGSTSDNLILNASQIYHTPVEDAPKS